MIINDMCITIIIRIAILSSISDSESIFSSKLIQNALSHVLYNIKRNSCGKWIRWSILDQCSENVNLEIAQKK